MSQARVALVTGSSGSLGAAAVSALAADGLDVIGVDIVPGESTQVEADLTTPEGTIAAVERAVELHGRLDVLVLNAGIQHVATLAEFPEDEWDRLLMLMCKGPFLAIRAAWPQLIARPGGRVVVVSSTNAVAAERHKVGYNAAKAGVVGVVKTAALEGAPHYLTSNAVAPGWMRTPLVERQITARAAEQGRSENEVTTDMLSRMPGGRFIEPAEVAAVIAFLAGGRAAGVSGALIPVDGGLLAW